MRVIEISKGNEIETKSQKPFTLAYPPSSSQLPAKRKVCLPFSLFLFLFLFSPHPQLLGFTSFLCIWFACRSNYDPYLGTSSGFVGGDIETLVLLVHFTHLFMSLLLITTYYFSIIASTIISKTVFVSGGGGGSGLFSSPVHSLNLFNSFTFSFSQEFVYNVVAVTLLLLTSLTLLVTVANRNQHLDGFPPEPGFGGKVAASVGGGGGAIAV